MTGVYARKFSSPIEFGNVFARNRSITPKVGIISAKGSFRNKRFNLACHRVAKFEVSSAAVEQLF